MPYNKSLAVSYTDRRDFARRIVELRPEGYAYFRLGAKLSSQMQVVEYCTAPMQDALSVGELARDLGMAPVRVRKVADPNARPMYHLRTGVNIKADGQVYRILN